MKLFSKIATLALGAAMAVGVGVAVGSGKASEARAADVSDTITASDLAATTTTYVDFSGVSGASGAVYAGNSAKSSAGVIQMRSKNSNSGIVSTTSGGTVKSVTITVQSGSNTIDVYGSNTAYTSASQLYNTVVGTKVGSTSSTGTITFTDSYSYVGIRSNNGAIYLTSVEVVWDDGQGGGGETSYTITYDANGGTGTMSDTTNTVADCTFTAPSGKVFSTWNTAANGSGTDVAPGTKVTADTDLFAIWVDKPLNVTLDKIGTDAVTAYSETLNTVDIVDGTDTYTLNYVNGKKQNDAMILQKSSGAFISNHTAAPGDITSVVLYINSGASGSATYDVAFGTSEYTTATSGVGAVNITGGNNHEYANSSVTGARYFCVTLGAAYNGQVLKIVVNYQAEEPVDPTLPNMEIWDNTWVCTDASGYWWTDEANLYWFYAHPEGDTEKDAYDRTILGEVTWTSSDTSVAIITTQPGGQGSITCYKPGSTTLTATKEGYNSAHVTVTFNAGAVSEILISGSMSKTAYTTAESWDPEGFVVKAYHGTTGWEDDVTSEATITFSPDAPADGVTSVVATAHWNDGEDDFSVSSSAQAVTVTVAHAGTAADPFTVAEGIAKCVEIGNKSGGEGPWVTTGKISSIVQVLTSGFQNARFYITEDGKTTGASLYVYDCKYLENAGFTEETAANIVVGATVTVTGNLLNYNNNTPEYARGCYLLAIQAPETGDVDVTFEPASTSFEIGATGTFTASSETSGATFAWSVDDSSVLSVNPSTGAYEALTLGVARVTVTASAGGKEGFAFVDFVVNGSAGTYYTVADANTIASGVESGKTTAYYIYIEGYVKEFATSSKDGSPRAFDIMTLDESASIMVYTNVDPYADFVDGLSLGDRIVVKGKIQNYNGTYEIVEPEKVASNASAITFALSFISQTDAICEGYDGVSSNKDALEDIWEGLYTSYNALYDNQKSVLMGAERDEGGTHVEQAVARYDYLVGKYGLDNFITGRTPASVPSGAYLSNYQSNIDSSSSITIIVIVAVASMTLLGVTLVLRKRKHQ